MWAGNSEKTLGLEKLKFSKRNGEYKMKIQFEYTPTSEHEANSKIGIDDIQKKKWDNSKRSYLDEQGKELLKSLEKGLIDNKQYQYPLNEIIYYLLDKLRLDNH